MLRRIADLALIDLLSIGAAALVFSGAGAQAPRAPLALLLALVLPGYALGAALFHEEGSGAAGRLLISLGLSLTLLVLGGMALDWTAVGLQGRSWAGFLVGLTLAASGVAAYLRLRSGGSLPHVRMDISLAQALLLLLAGLVAAGALLLGRSPAPSDGLQGYTLLWLLPADPQHPEDIPVGISSREFAPTSYRLELSLNEQPFLAWPEIDLQPGQMWKTKVELPGSIPDRATLEALLYRRDAPGLVYRRAKIWLIP